MEKTKIRIVERVEEQKPMKGIFSLRVYRHVNGERRLIDEYEERNLIVNDARVQMAHLVAGEHISLDSNDDPIGGRHITQIGFGIDSTAAMVADTMLTDPFMKPLDGFEYPEMGQVQFNWGLGINEANGKEIKEFGLFCEDGKLFARRVRLKPINKEDDISLEGTWTIIF